VKTEFPPGRDAGRAVSLVPDHLDGPCRRGGDALGQGSRGAGKGEDDAGGVIETVRAEIFAEGSVPVAMQDPDAPVTAIEGQDGLRSGRKQAADRPRRLLPFLHHRTMWPSPTGSRPRGTRATHPIVGHSTRMSSPGAPAGGMAMRRRSIRGGSLHPASARGRHGKTRTGRPAPGRVVAVWPTPPHSNAADPVPLRMLPTGRQPTRPIVVRARTGHAGHPAGKVSAARSADYREVLLRAPAPIAHVAE